LAVQGQVPFIVQLINANTGANFCGGSLIGPYHVLTASHCVDGTAAGDIKIWAGALNTNDADGYEVDVDTIYMHPQFDLNSLRNDVTVIKLAKPFPKSVGLRSIRITSNAVAPGTVVTTAGWGNTGSGYPDDLYYVETTVLSYSQCIQSEPAAWVFDSEMVCAHDSSQGSCYGDSGGPMYTGTKAAATQHGVVSWGSSNGCATAASVYARVSTYYDWIVAKTTHYVSTPCVDCEDNAPWIAMCKSIGGIYRLTTTAYQCRSLDIEKTRKISHEWNNCANTKLRDLCEKIGRYMCTDGVASCTKA
jgi:secreted trypsin-like serine protease